MTDVAVLRMVVSLIFVVLLILAVAWLGRKVGWLRPRTNQAIKVLGIQSLGTRTQVALLEIEDVRLVIGIASNQITLLHTLPAATAQTPTSSVAVPAAKPAPENEFHAVLDSTLKRP